MLDQFLTLPCGLTIKNRIVKSAMTERMAAADGSPTPRLIHLFERFSKGGVGMMLTGNVAVDGQQLEGFGNVTFETFGHPEPYRRWAAAGRREGVPIIVQLNHPGRQAMRNVAEQPVAPSAIGLPNKKYFAVPRALTEVEIHEIIENFVSAAKKVSAAGFAGVEIHAAHGYLISQFLSPNVNVRTDQWGGPLVNRSRLLIQIIRQIRASVPPSFAVGVKLNAGDFVKGGMGPEESALIMQDLDTLRVDFIEISGGTFERPASFGAGLPKSTREREGYFLDLAAMARRVTTVPLILTGGLRSSAAMNGALSSGVCDMIGLARPLAVEPDFPRRLLSDPAACAISPELKLPKGPISTLAELLWYREQLDRISVGKSPNLHGSALFALFRTLARDKWLGWRRHRFIRRLAKSSKASLRESAA
jgi:2,4-dienoyl-CoA reductase-like NADH-dependent reductase (Old Yellow Enzyme family)